MKHVKRRLSYRDDLLALTAFVAKDKPGAAAKLRLAIDDQVSNLADPNFPRRKGRVPGTRELVAHENYIVILIEDDATVEVINVVHSMQQYP